MIQSRDHSEQQISNQDDDSQDLGEQQEHDDEQYQNDMTDNQQESPTREDSGQIDKDNYNDQIQQEEDQQPPQIQPKQQTKEDFLSKPFNQLNPLEKLKYSQYMFKQNWKGISTEFTGRPGTSQLCNRKRQFSDPAQLTEENIKAAAFLRVLSILARIEQDIPITQQVQNAVAGDLRQNKSAYNFYQNKKQQQINQYIVDNQDICRYLNDEFKLQNFKTFSTIKMSQLLNDLPPTQSFGRANHIENSELLYKILRGDTKLVRSMLEANGLSYTESHEWNILWSSSSCKAYLYEGLNEHQRINHFPQSYEVTRKDRLCFNMVKMQEKHGRQNYDIVPDTYILPQEYKEFQQHFNLLAQKEPKKNIWIVKPANLSRGRGIHLIDSLSDVQIDDVSVVSRYITNPLLINGHKFDLRIYVLVTSYEPLKIYVYKEGLARFASETYSSKIDKDNKFMHLTNYSINKKNDNFVYNQNHEQDDVGFKWSLSAFCSHLEQVGIDMSLMWSRIYDLIIKAILSGEHYVNAALKKYNLHRNNCFEVFGYDVILDSELKPWLLEVNLSPSLACESPLDLTIKSNLLADTFNMIGISKFDRRKESLNKIKNRGNNAPKTVNTTANNVMAQNQNDIFLNSQNNLITPQVAQLIERLVQQEAELESLQEPLNQACLLRNRDIIFEAMSEFSRKGNFVRIYPSRSSNMYDQFFQTARPINKLLYKVLYSDKIFKLGNSLPPQIMSQSSKVYKEDSQAQVIELKSSKRTVYSNNAASSSQFKSGTQTLDNTQSNQALHDSAYNSQNGRNTPKSNTQQMSKQSTVNSLRPMSSSVVKSSQHLRKRSNDQQIIQQHHSTNNIMSNNSQLANNNSTHSQSKYLRQTKSPQTVKTHSSKINNFHETQSNNSSVNNAENYSQRSHQTNNTQKSTITNNKNIESKDQRPQEKIIITGDDILIEYVSRVVYVIKIAEAQKLDQPDYFELIDESIRRFVDHHVWNQKDQEKPQSDSLLWQQMDSRMNEMLDRRRRLIKYTLKKEGKLITGTSNEFDYLYKEVIDRKNTVVQRFSSSQLEDLLKTSTKNVAQEVVSCMIPVSEEHGLKGLLHEVEKIYPQLAKQRKDMIKQARSEKNENRESEGPKIDKSKGSQLSRVQSPNRNTKPVSSQAYGLTNGISSSSKRTMSRQSDRYSGPSESLNNNSVVSSYRTPLTSGTHVNKTFSKGRNEQGATLSSQTSASKNQNQQPLSAKNQIQPEIGTKQAFRQVYGSQNQQQLFSNREQSQTIQSTRVMGR